MYNIGSIKHDEIKHNRHIRGDTTNSMTCVYVGCPRIEAEPSTYGDCIFIFDKSIYVP